jgi:hypothetical protein
VSVELSIAKTKPGNGHDRIGLSRGGKIRVLVEGDVRLDDDDITLLDEEAHASHRVHGSFDHPEGLLFTGLQLIVLGGMIFGKNGRGANDDHTRPADRELDRIVLETHRRRGLDAFHSPAIAKQ